MLRALPFEPRLADSKQDVYKALTCQLPHCAAHSSDRPVGSLSRTLELLSSYNICCYMVD